MKVRKIYWVMAMLIMALTTGCYYDVITPPDPNAPPQNVSFSNDLQPIFNTSCATPGCHGDGGHNPTLTADKSYNALMSGGFVNTTIPTESILYKEINSGLMPPTGKLPQVQIQMVLDWIKIGAPNN
ncbi:cytochrome c [Chitinophagaceae bacterium 26-R-25]|nr:cytochrome c [Chitinophagaceae bacterium 26-R-25]